MSRLLEEKAKVMVSSMTCRAQKVKGLSHLVVVTVVQVSLAGSADELTRLTGEYGDGSTYLLCNPWSDCERVEG